MAQTLFRWRFHRSGKPQRFKWYTHLVQLCSFIQGFQPSPLGNQTIPRRSFPEPAQLRFVDRPVADCKSLNTQGRYGCCKPDGEQVVRKEDDLENKAFKLQPRPAVRINNMPWNFAESECVNKRGREAEKLEIKPKRLIWHFRVALLFLTLNNLKVQYHTPSFYPPLTSRHEHTHSGSQWACTQLSRLWSGG